MALRPTPQDLSRELGEVVRKALAEAHIAQRNLDHLTGIPMTTLRRRLNGQSPFSTDELARIAELLGVTVTSLIAQAEDAAA